MKTGLVSEKKLTNRFVFIVEHIRKPGAHMNLQKSNYGWVSYSHPVTCVRIKKSFTQLDQLPDLISDMISDIDQVLDNNDNESG